MDGNGERVDMMKVLVTGADGMLGRDVMRALREKHVNARGVDVADFDVTDGAAVREWVTAEQPDAIIHLAAYTDLLKAETEPAKCIDVNAMGTLNMVRAALAIGAKLMLMSSSEVFGAAPDVIHGTRDKTCAANVYGLSKGAGGRSCARADDAVLHRPHGLLVLRRAEGGNLRHSGDSAGSSEADDFRRPDGLPDVHA